MQLPRKKSALAHISHRYLTALQKKIWCYALAQPWIIGLHILEERQVQQVSCTPILLLRHSTLRPLSAVPSIVRLLASFREENLSGDSDSHVGLRVEPMFLLSGHAPLVGFSPVLVPCLAARGTQCFPGSTVRSECSARLAWALPRRALDRHLVHGDVAVFTETGRWFTGMLDGQSGRPSFCKQRLLLRLAFVVNCDGHALQRRLPRHKRSKRRAATRWPSCCSPDAREA